MNIISFHTLQKVQVHMKLSLHNVPAVICRNTDRGVAFPLPGPESSTGAAAKVVQGLEGQMKEGQRSDPQRKKRGHSCSLYVVIKFSMTQK
jgi:hypothetical protein